MNIKEIITEVIAGMPRISHAGKEIIMTWEEWSAELVRLGGDRYGPRGVIEECGGADAWRGYFDDGYSPQDALDEDASYW